jgi:hypothetical protein
VTLSQEEEEMSDQRASTDLPDDLEAALAARSTRRGGPSFSLVLAGVVLLGLGFLLGAFVQRHVGSNGGSSAAAPGAVIPSVPAGGFLNSGGSGSTSNGTVTAGTVERVVGHTVYVRRADGSTVKVTTDSSTSVTVSEPGSVSDLRPGQDVLVVGTPGSSGTVRATRISEGTGAFPGGPDPFPTPTSGTGTSG